MVTGFDFETFLMGPGLLAPPPVCLSTSDSELYHAQLHPDDTAQKLHELFQGEVVGANICFDACVAMARWPELTAEVFDAYENGQVLDVQLNQKLADNARGRLYGFVGNTKITYSLAALEQRLLGIDRSAAKRGDSWRMRYAELADIPINEWPKEVREYAIDDAIGAYNVLHEQLKFGELWANDAQAQARSALVLQIEECRGVHSDGARIKELEREARRRFDKVTAVLVSEKLVRGKSVPKKEGTKDTKAARRRMIEKCKEAGLDVKITKTGKKKVKERDGEYADFLPPDDPLALEYPSCDKEACARVGDEVLEQYAERTSLVTLIKTHIPDLHRGAGDEPIQPSYNTVLETGRTSARKHQIANGLQVQNQDKGSGARECIRARKGTLFVAADAGGLELAAWAQACLDLIGWSTLADDLREGKDPHLVVAAALAEIEYPEALERKQKREPTIKQLRDLAKVVNFGFQGGMGPRAFVTYARLQGYKITLEKAEELKRIWQHTRPEHKPYFRHASEVEDSGTLIQLRSGRLRGGLTFTKAANGYFQGLGADGSLRAHWYVTKAAYAEPDSPLYRNLWPVLFVHDEIISEATAYDDLLTATPDERKALACIAQEKQRLMEKGYNEFIPDVPVKCEPTIARWWSKKYMDDPIYDENGILIPLDLAEIEGVPAYDASGERVI